MEKVIIVDSALRDGNHTVKNQFSLEDIEKVVTSLDQANIDYIEVGYGYGLGCVKDSDKATDSQILEVATKSVKNSKIAILVFPNYATLEELESALDYDVELVRLAVQSNNVEPAKEYIKLCVDKGVKVGGFMMMAHRVDADTLVQEALKLQEYGVDNITVTDSAGFMVVDEVREKISKVREGVRENISIGFHSHDNLGLAIGNSFAAIENGASLVDTAVGGLGAGAGNTPTESLIAVLDKSNIDTKGDLFKTLDASHILRDIVSKYGVNIINREDTIMIGYSGVYSTFMNPGKEVSKEYNVDYKELLMEAAKQKLVPGQEEQLIEIAKKL